MRPSGKVLVVDDEPLVVQAIVRLLASVGIPCAAAGNGAEALRVLQQEPIRLVLTDVRMPVLDGPGLAERLVELLPAPPPLIFLTAYADRSRSALLACGAVQVLGKPIDPVQLLHIVGRELDRQA